MMCVLVFPGKKELIRDLSYFYDLLEAVHGEADPFVVEKVRSDLMHNGLPLLRDYYSQILDISLLILDGDGVELTASLGDRNLHSLVVNLEDAFESYLLQVFKSSKAIAEAGITVKSGNSDGEKSLFSDNSNYDAKPDYVFFNSRGQTRVVGDAKYKLKLVETDRYQLISHAVSYCASTAFFVTPCDDNGLTGPVKIGEIGSVALQIYCYRINLAAADLAAEECRLCDWVADLSSENLDSQV